MKLSLTNEVTEGEPEMKPRKLRIWDEAKRNEKKKKKKKKRENYKNKKQVKKFIKKKKILIITWWSWETWKKE